MINLYQLHKLIHLNNNIKKSVLQGSIISLITIISYLSIIVFTTPNLPATASISATIQVNYPIIIGLAIGTGIQGFIISYRKQNISNNCVMKKKGFFLRSSSTGSGLRAALSSFFSFFSLVPLGCCGSWLFILSYLPLVFGNGVSVFMINHSNILSYIGLIIISIITIISIIKLYKDLKVFKNKNILAEDKEQGNSRYL